MELVITPTLNEAENIPILVREVLAHGRFELLVVDDNSPDGTGRIVEELRRDEPRLHLLRRMDNPGFRNAYLDGVRWALAQPGIRNIFTMDADLSHNPKYLPALSTALEQGADFAIGSRYTRGGGVENWSFPRRFLSRNANRFARLVTGLPVRDCTAGFLGIRAELLRGVNLEEITSKGYGFLVELKHLLWRHGGRPVEVPIVFTDRRFGETKFTSAMIHEAMNACFHVRSLGRGDRT